MYSLYGEANNKNDNNDKNDNNNHDDNNKIIIRRRRTKPVTTIITTITIKEIKEVLCGESQDKNLVCNPPVGNLIIMIIKIITII